MSNTNKKNWNGIIKVAKNNYENYTKEQLIDELKKLNKRKKYGLVWEEEKTKEKFEDDAEGKLPVLVEDKKREINTDDDKPTHILIEGDNYHALSVLNYTHAKSIDVIYIDPPYNIGNNDFKYNDKFVDREDSYRHSKWLSFMSKRLTLAKHLLKNDGVIFISIDDNELAQVKLLLDDIFNNTLVAMYIHKNNSSKNQANLVSISTEYMLLYKKSKEGLKKAKWKVSKKGAKDIANTFNKLKKKKLSLEEISEQIKEMYSRPKYAHLSRWNKVDDKGVFKDADLSREGGPRDFTIINPVTRKKCKIPDRGWGKSYQELLRLQKAEMIWYGDDNTPPGLKDYITSDDEMVPDNFLYYDNSVDTRLIKDMFRELVFENPKPLEMIKTIIKMASPDNGIIVDFFAGSGTTGHAILDLNGESGSERKFILCTNNENNICTEVCYPRVKKVIQGYKSSKGKRVKGLGGNLKYYNTNFVGSEPTHRNKKLLTDKSIEMLCLKENTFDEVISNKDFFIFKSKIRFTAILFNELKIEEFKKEIKKLKLPVSIYVFSLEGDDFKEEFESLKNDITLCSIPEAILKVYRRIYETTKTKK